MSTMSIDRRELMGAGLLAGLGAALAPRLALAQPGTQSGSGERLANTKAFVERWVGPGKFPGLVCSFGLRGRPTQFVVKGSEGFTDPDPVTPDSLFRIYSMTKPVTGIAAMILIDEGKLGLDQPIADLLPKFARMQVQVTPDGSITDLRPARTPITVRHLLTHTAGLGYTFVQRGPIRKAYEEAGLIPARGLGGGLAGLSGGTTVQGLATFADRLAEMPLIHEPGTSWSYSVSLDLLGRVIEVASGQSFDSFLRNRIFEPCGMNSTWFEVPASEARRLTTNYAAVAGALAPIDPGVGSIYLEEDAFPFGGAGLVSSPRDYDRFLEMLGNYGKIGGKRVMSEPAVRVGTSNLMPEGADTRMMAMMGGAAGGFGAGGRVGLGAQAGIFGWAGAAGTVGTVDLRRGIRSSIFVQFMPPNALPLLTEYQQALQADVRALAGTA